MADEIVVGGSTPRPQRKQADSMQGVGELLAGMPIPMTSPAIQVEQPVLEERKSLWRSMLDKVQNDPNLRTALMSTAIGMMRNPGFGQNSWDTAANALAAGMGTYQQGRQLDVQNKQAERKLGLEEELGRGNLGVAQQNAQNYGKSVDTQATVAQGNLENQQTLTAIQQQKANLDAALEPRRVAADEKRAQADVDRAAAYRVATQNSGGSTGQNVQLVNARKAALMKLNPGMTDEEATVQAQNDILLTAKVGNNPASLAASLFKSNLTAWQNSFDNLGKSPTPQQLEELKQLSLEQARDFAKLNRQATGVIPETATSGPIDRVTNSDQTLIGRKVAGGDGSYAEIVREAPGVVTLKLPNGREVTVPLEQITPHIVAE